MGKAKKIILTIFLLLFFAVSYIFNQTTYNGSKASSKLDDGAQKLRKIMEEAVVKKPRRATHPAKDNDLEKKLKALVRNKLMRGVQGGIDRQRWLRLPGIRYPKEETFHRKLLKVATISVDNISNIETYKSFPSGNSLIKPPSPLNAPINEISYRLSQRTASVTGNITGKLSKTEDNEYMSRAIHNLKELTYKAEKNIVKLKELMKKLNRASLCDFQCYGENCTIRTKLEGGSLNCNNTGDGRCVRICLLLTDAVDKLYRLKEIKWYKQDEIQIIKREVQNIFDEIISNVEPLVNEMVSNNANLNSLRSKASAICSMIVEVATGKAGMMSWLNASVLFSLPYNVRRKLYEKLVAEFNNINRELPERFKVNCQAGTKLEPANTHHSLDIKFTVMKPTENENNSVLPMDKEIRSSAEFLYYKVIYKFVGLKGISELDEYYNLISGKGTGYYSSSHEMLKNLLPFIKKEEILEALNWNKCAYALNEQVIQGSNLLAKLGIEVSGDSVVNMVEDSVLLLADEKTLEKFEKVYKKLRDLDKKAFAFLSRKNVTEEEAVNLLGKYLHEFLDYSKQAKEILDSIISKKMEIYKLIAKEIDELMIERRKNCKQTENCNYCLLYLANLVRTYLSILMDEKELVDKELKLFGNNKEKLSKYTEIPKPYLESFVERLRHDLGAIYLLINQVIGYNFGKEYTILQGWDKCCRDACRSNLQCNNKQAGRAVNPYCYGTVSNDTCFPNSGTCYKNCVDDCNKFKPSYAGEICKFEREREIKDRVTFFVQTYRTLGNFLSYLQYIFNIFACVEIKKEDGEVGKLEDIYKFFQSFANVKTEMKECRIGQSVPDVDAYFYFFAFSLPDIVSTSPSQQAIISVDTKTGKIVKAYEFLGKLLCLNSLWYNGFISDYNQNSKLQLLLGFNCYDKISFLSDFLSFLDGPNFSLPGYLKSVINYVNGKGKNAAEYGFMPGELSGNPDEDIWNILFNKIDDFSVQMYLKNNCRYWCSSYQEMLKGIKSFRFDEDLLNEVKKNLREQLKALIDLRAGEKFVMDKVIEELFKESFKEPVKRAGWNINYLFESQDREEICKKYQKVLIR